MAQRWGADVNAEMKKTGAALNRGRSNQIVGTPIEFIQSIERRFGPIGFDLAATPDNAKAARFFTEQDDSLKQHWALHPECAGRLLWLNPPFGNIAVWARKCATEATLGARIVMLVPASVGANWFRDHVFNHASVYFLNGRLTFDGHDQPFAKDCLVAHYDKSKHSEISIWNWREVHS